MFLIPQLLEAKLEKQTIAQTRELPG